MKDTEKELFQAISQIQSNQKATEVHMKYICKAVDRIDKNLQDREDKEDVIFEKVRNLEQKVFKPSFAGSKLVKIIAAVLGTLAIGMSMTCGVKSCNIEGLQSSSAVQTQPQD